MKLFTNATAKECREVEGGAAGQGAWSRLKPRIRPYDGPGLDNTARLKPTMEEAELEDSVAGNAVSVF